MTQPLTQHIVNLMNQVEAMLNERDALKAELEAYKKAKAENDERFMLERDEARRDVERLKGECDRWHRLDFNTQSRINQLEAKNKALVAALKRVLPLAESWADAEHKTHPMWDDIDAARREVGK